MRQSLKNQAGFSLVELMVVVAIITILAMVAVPRFQTFQAKARQSEATANLSALFQAETAFVSQWNQYFSCFADIGYSPQGTLRYNIGFSAFGQGLGVIGYSGPSQANPQAATNACAATTSFSTISNAVCDGTRCLRSAFVAAIPGGNVTGLPATGPTFQAAAAGNIDDDNDPDIWTINQAKTVANFPSDL